MMKRLLTLILLFAAGANLAPAEPYWVGWTGDTFPETEGWTRYSSDPPAERWLDDGSLFIDSRADWYMSEQYGQPRPGMMSPNPGETFVMHWRVKVHEIIGYSDPGVSVWSDDQHALVLSMGVDFIQSSEELTTASFAPYEWHEFTLQSEDMLTYQLYIDGAPAFDGSFYESAFSLAGAYWGDHSSHRSLAEWDYVAFGIVPEPSSGLSVLVVACAAVFVKRATDRRESPVVEGGHRRLEQV